MNFQPIPAPAHLKHFVRGFFLLESEDVTDGPATFRTTADGSPGLVFQRSENHSFYDSTKQLPGIFLYGQATKPREIHSNEKFSVLGIYFHPDALQSVLGFKADALTDSCLDLNEHAREQGYNLADQLLSARTVEEQIKILSAYVHVQVRMRKKPADTVTQHALSHITKSQGEISLKELQQKLGLSERSLERRFKQNVGVSPKLFARICQFQRSLNQLRNGGYDKLSDVAFENEYADQSHFIRVFKEFTGLSPLQYEKQPTLVVESFAY